MGNIVNIPTYSYSDLTIMPCGVSPIEHRKECNPYHQLDGKTFLPLFTAPMNTVVDETNFYEFPKNNIIPILPRTVSLFRTISQGLVNGRWVALSLERFKSLFCDKKIEMPEGDNKVHVCIDIANGHMQQILDIVAKAKDKFGERLVVMCGNIGDASMYEEYAKVGIDYARVGIGSGGGCLTTTNTAIHTPQASLIDWCAKRKKFLGFGPKIVADGGIRNYSDIIKALALGADFVMCGQIFAQAIESAGIKKVIKNDEYISFTPTIYKELTHDDSEWSGILTEDFVKQLATSWNIPLTDISEIEAIGKIYIDFYGMASKEGQIAMNGAKTRTSEGTKKRLEVKYHLSEWVENFTDYLQSAMSYVGARTLNEFQEKATLIPNTISEIDRVNK